MECFLTETSLWPAAASFLETHLRSIFWAASVWTKAAGVTGLGSVVVEESEKAVAALGGQSVILHAQCRAQHFYHTLGYQEYGPVEDEEGVPHQWMRKKV